MQRFEVSWRARETPLEPVAVIASGNVALALARRLLELSDEELKRFRGVSWEGGLAIEGDAVVLPWTDGVVYLGHDARAPRLLLPCALEPDAPLDLWARAFERQLAGDWAAPLMVLPQDKIAVSLGNARSLDRHKLEAWLSMSTP